VLAVLLGPAPLFSLLTQERFPVVVAGQQAGSFIFRELRDAQTVRLFRRVGPSPFVWSPVLWAVRRVGATCQTSGSESFEPQQLRCCRPARAGPAV